MRINEAQAQATATTDRGDERYSSGLSDGAEIPMAAGGQTKAEVPLTMETVITRANMMLAWQRVVENKGAAGVDNLSVAWLKLLMSNGLPAERMDWPAKSGTSTK
ncbi:Retron-type reverse transcriptase-like protein [Salmonella enterica subsp. enterica serovar Sandiego]